MNPVVHFEMSAEDKDRMVTFYEGVFGWKMQHFGPEMGNYVMAQTTETDEKGMIQKPGRINGGFYERTDNQAMTPPHIVIAVEDYQVHMKKIADAGGKIIGEPMDIPNVGWFVLFKDTEDNVAGILQPSQQM